MKATHATIPAYHRALAREDKAICDLLKAEIEKALPQAEAKIWHGTPSDLARNLSMMGRRYDKDVYVVETAFTAYPDGTAPFPLTDAGQTAYLRQIDSLVRATPNGHGKGWLWREPTGEAYLGTPRGLFDKTGNARPALYAFDRQTDFLAKARSRVTEMLPKRAAAPVRLFAAPTGPVRANGSRFPYKTKIYSNH